MPCSNFVAKVKKIDIVNKATQDNWSQSITIVLSNIALNDDNLVAIRKFKPNEEISVSFKTLQLSMMDTSDEKVINALDEEEDGICEDGLFLVDYEEELSEEDAVVKKFEF